MQSIRYKVISDRFGGYFIVTYRDGCLNNILIEFKQPLTPQQWFHITNILTPELKDLNAVAFTKSGLTIIELPVEDTPLPGNERVAVFCEFYERETGLKYKVTRSAGAKMKDLAIGGNEFAICIKAYFESQEWYLTPKSIENFCGKINQIRQLISCPPPVKQKKFPIPYDANFDKGLSIDEHMQYTRVLRDAGYRLEYYPGAGDKWVKQ